MVMLRSRKVVESWSGENSHVCSDCRREAAKWSN